MNVDLILEGSTKASGVAAEICARACKLRLVDRGVGIASGMALHRRSSRVARDQAPERRKRERREAVRSCHGCCLLEHQHVSVWS
jgi:hypothetical protein